MKVKIRGLVFAGFAAAVFAQSAMAVSDSDKTVTSKTYVDTNFQNLNQKQGSGLDGSTPVTTIGNNATTDDNHYPTSRNVYLALQEIESQQGDFQRKLANGEKPSLGVYNADGTNVWKQAGNGTYVTVTEETNSITFDVPSNKIATIGADNPSTLEVEVSEITADSTKLTTGKAVYEYVRDYAGDTYQPKVDSEGLKVGIRTGNANDGYNSTWYSIVAGRRNYDGNNQPTHLTTPGYVAFDQYVDSNGVGDVAVDLDRTRILEGNGAGEYITLQNSGEKLATGLAVAEYSVPMNWTERAPSDYANKKLVTDNSGNVVLAEDTTANIPSDMPDECDTASGTHVCALVAYWAAASQDPETGAQIPAGLKYEWTIMAPTGNNG